MTTAAPNLSPRRLRTRERRVERIVSAAFALIESDGFDALTMARVADAVDLSAGALYRYFASKDALLATLEARTIERIAELLSAQRAQWQVHLPSAPDVASLCELIAAAAFYLELAQHDPRAFRLVAATLGDPRPLVDDGHAMLVAEPLRALILEVSQLFRAAEACGAVCAGAAPLRTIVFWTSLHGVVSTAKLDRLSDGEGWFAPTRLALELTTTLLVGWGADPEAVRQAQAWQDNRLRPHTTVWETT